MTPVPYGQLPVEAQRGLDAGYIVEITTTGPGAVESVSAEGAGAKSTGGELSEDFDASAPQASLGGGVKVDGGSLARSFKADAFTPGNGGGAFGLIAFGAVAIFIAAFLFWKGSLKGGVTFGAAGVGLLLAAFQPWFLVLAGLGIAAWVVVSLYDNTASAGRMGTIRNLSRWVEKRASNGDPGIKDELKAVFGPREKAVIRKAKKREGLS